MIVKVQFIDTTEKTTNYTKEKNLSFNNEISHFSYNNLTMFTFYVIINVAIV